MSNQCKHANCLSFNLQDKWCTDCGAAYVMGNPALNPYRRWRQPTNAHAQDEQQCPSCPHSRTSRGIDARETECLDCGAVFSGLEWKVARKASHDPTPPIDWQARLEGLENFVSRLEVHWENRFTRHIQKGDVLRNNERENSAVAMHGHDDRINQLSEQMLKLQSMMIATPNMESNVLQLEDKANGMLERHYRLRNRVDRLYETFDNIGQTCGSLKGNASDAE